MRLPSDMRELVVKKLEKLEPMELAAYADTRWHVRNAKPPSTCAAAATSELDSVQGVEELSDTVAAMAVSTKTRGNRNSRGGGRGGRSGGQHTGGDKQPPRRYVCFKHCKWGKKAWGCDDPENCKFSGNGEAGGHQ